ncbi:MAG TPA: FadR/GntR family transcriptional regulator [Streptosporangiaceae bacterium]|nr:FadR/GntR family transcriptional regulator [Streptosporangiaceae bacterium]
MADGQPVRRRGAAADLPGIRPVSLPRVSDEVAEQIRRLIVTEQLAEGARLPAERDLADRFGVSRPMVSQALRMLALMGLVDIRRGSGAYVLRRPQAMVTASVGLLLDLHGSVGDLAELRLWLETLGVEHAARRQPGSAQIADLGDALRRLAGATGSAPAWIAADTVFHAMTVGAAGNTYLTAMYEGVHTAVLAHEYEHWVRTETEPAWLAPPGTPVLLDLHQAIYDAVAAGDGEAARAAVLRHHLVMLDHLAAAQGLSTVR